MDTYRELTGAGVTTRTAAALTGLPRSTATRRRPTPVVADAAPRVPANRLSAVERLEILAVLDQPRFVDLPPIQIYATLLDEGIYLCSISTMYRILAEHDQLVERRRIARHPARTVPELVATAPGQVYSWDITKLAGPCQGLLLRRLRDDRHLLPLHRRRPGPPPRVRPARRVDMMRQVFDLHGTPQVVHADRGTSMTSKTVAQLLADLDVTRSHSRPKVSNDNPYSEAWFKTLKYAPTFPDRFGSLADAQQYMNAFVDGYNHHHRHTGIGLHTPADVHYGHAATVHAGRQATLAQARAQHPERFTSSQNPKIIDLPDAAWINQPPQATAA